jgi:hypothetical protein
MPDMQRTLSPVLAVVVGWLVVNVPVIAIFLCSALFAAQSDLNIKLSLLIAFVAAWTWWSLVLPRWRLWAYERVPSTGALQKWALAVGLVWPRGSFLERTEIKSSALRERQQVLERQFP